jgi:hypothetical protein
VGCVWVWASAEPASKAVAAMEHANLPVKRIIRKPFQPR